MCCQCIQSFRRSVSDGNLQEWICARIHGLSARLCLAPAPDKTGIARSTSEFLSFKTDLVQRQ